MRIPLDRQSSTPLYQQLVAFLQAQIEAGAIPPDTRLPASRELAGSLGISRLTVTNAYAELEALGLVVSRAGSGTYVAYPLVPPLDTNGQMEGHWPLWQEDLRYRMYPPTQNDFRQRRQENQNPTLISFRDGLGSVNLFALDEFRKTMQMVLRRDGAAALGYGDYTSGGYPGLREVIAHILSNQGIPTHADHVLITSGSQQAISLVARLLLQRGDTVLVESPTYGAGLDLFRSLGARVVGVPMDEEGMLMDKLETALRTTHPRLIYTIPTFQNPTGRCMCTPRRREMIALANHYNVPILEDDFVGDLRYEGRAQPALKALDGNGTVIYVNTFSKVLVPGLRIGYLVADGPVYDQLLIHKWLNDQSTSELLQRALEAYITVGRYQAHLRRVCQVYRARRDGMLAALQRYMPEGTTWSRPQGGLFIWLQLPQQMAAADLLPLAQAQGVTFAPGAFYFPDEDGFDYIRLNFTTQTPERIETGIKRLAKAIREQMTRIGN